MDLQFSGSIWHWRGPSPYYFVSVPDEECSDIKEVAAALTYGWGVIPVTVRVGDTEFRTSLFPKDGGYAVPLKDAVRKAEGIGEGDQIAVRLLLGEPS